MRPEKASIVSELSEALKRSPFVLVTDYRGMKVADFGELRNRLAPARAEVHVVKNNFLKLAMADSGFPEVGDQFAGQTAVVTGEADVAPVAKIFKTFATEFKIAALKLGFVDRAVLSTADLETLAELLLRLDQRCARQHEHRVRCSQAARDLDVVLIAEPGTDRHGNDRAAPAREHDVAAAGGAAPRPPAACSPACAIAAT